MIVYVCLWTSEPESSRQLAGPGPQWAVAGGILGFKLTELVNNNS